MPPSLPGTMRRGTRSRPAPHLSWSVAKLQTALRARGVSFENREKKESLIRRWEQHCHSESTSSLPSRRSADANNGRGRSRATRGASHTQSRQMEAPSINVEPGSPNASLPSDSTNNLLTPETHVTPLPGEVNVQEAIQVTNSHKSVNSQPSLHLHPSPAPTGMSTAAASGLEAQAITAIAKAVATATVQALAPLLPTPSPAAVTTAQNQERNPSAQTSSNRVGPPANHVTQSAASCEPGSGQTLLSTRGVDSSSLPNLHIVAADLRKDIIAGKHINLAKLLIPNYTERAPREMQLGETTISLKPLSDSRLEKPLAIHEFIVAFNIYVDIITEVYPNRRTELDAYLSDMIKMASRYPGFRYYEYHNAFSEKASQYLQEKGIKIFWGARDQVLFTEYFSGQTPASCKVCQSIGHATRFCPLSLQGSRNQSAPFAYGANQSTKMENDRDKHGRNIIRVEGGHSVCNNFNRTLGCSFVGFPRIHVCSICKKAHPATRCTMKTGPGPKNG